MLATLQLASPSLAAEKTIVETAVSAGQFKTLAAALEAAGLVEALNGEGHFTVFAPTDEAFGKLPASTIETLLRLENKGQLTDILTYHVVKGEVLAKDVVKRSGAVTLQGQRIDIKTRDKKVFVDNSQVVKTDIRCSNGVIHVIDAVLMPAADILPTTAKKAGNFKTLLAAAEAAGLVKALSGKYPLTVFAPTDDAFAKLPEGTVQSLLQPENREKLAAILKYHVVPGRVYSEQAVAAGRVETLQGSKLRIAVDHGKAKVNKASLVATDIDAANGVIHVIDKVLLPESNSEEHVSLKQSSADLHVHHVAPKRMPHDEKNLQQPHESNLCSASSSSLDRRYWIHFPWMATAGIRAGSGHSSFRLALLDFRRPLSRRKFRSFRRNRS